MIGEKALTRAVKFHFWIPLLLAALMVVMQLAVAGNYGYFADEMYLVDCSRHLDIGYIDHPPFSVLVAGLSTALFGTSILGLRLWPALAGGLTVLLAAAMAREMGGGRFAQSLASMLIFAVIVLPALFNFFSMNAFDILLVTIAAWLLIKLLKAPSPKLWLLFGLVAGIGLQNKLTMLVFGFSAAAALLLTRKRRLLVSPWPWLAGFIALVSSPPTLSGRRSTVGRPLNSSGLPRHSGIPNSRPSISLCR
jgi:4-amino-4-deoxy-L-arabinose transferase-like glycosyltransferase